MIAWVLIGLAIAALPVMVFFGIRDVIRTTRRQIKEGRPVGGRGWFGGL